jgi:predicted metal-dependent HD superfamily phosphohydrolase
MLSRPEDLWRSLWKRVSGAGDGSAAFADLRARYGEPHRAYHTLAHIEHCLAEFEAAKSFARNVEAIEWAIWYHDAIYDTHGSDNEERSAELGRRVARDASIAGAIADEAVAHILSSKHRETPTAPDTRLFVDVDLAILGQPWDSFAVYEQGIRREYQWVPAWLRVMPPNVSRTIRFFMPGKEQSPA